MSSISTRIINIYKSRKTLLEQLDSHGYKIDDYENFTMNEIDSMLSNSQLDMLLSNEQGNKVYVKYYLDSKQIKPNTLDQIIEDLFDIENILTKNDTLVIITDEEPNDTIINKIKYLFDKDGIFVVIHNIKRLQFNILKHQLVPECKVLSSQELDSLKDKYNIKDLSQLPEISRFDPQSLAMCIRPGQVCHLLRNSVTSVEASYYRVCV